MNNHDTILSLCHNVKTPKQAAPDAGHVWLEVRTGDHVTTYGLWPEMSAINRRLQSLVEPKGWDQSGTHVQKDVEHYWKFAKSHFTPTWKRSWRLDQAKTAELHTRIKQKQVYNDANFNCADWASSIVSGLVGLDLVAKKELAPTRGFAGRIADPSRGTMISAPRLMERSVLRLDWRDDVLRVTKPVNVLAAEPMLPVTPTMDSGNVSLLHTLAAPMLVGGMLTKKAGMATLLS
jgi:hypothetical protein